MKKIQLRIILTALLAVVFLAGAGMMIRQQIQYRKTVAVSAEAARLAGLETGGAPAAPRLSVPVAAAEEAEAKEEEEPPEPLPEEAYGLAELDLAALREVNADVVGWICIPDTAVSYPLMQGEDNQYYLKRDWKGEPLGSGSVFLECANSPDMSDYHTIVYGHNMRDGTMFGGIRLYSGPDYWREHPNVYIAVDGGIFRYEIFSAQYAGVEDIVYRLNIKESHLEEEFLEYCMENSEIDTGLEPDPGGRFVTLSTCTGTGFYGNRWVIHGALAGEYKI